MPARCASCQSPLPPGGADVTILCPRCHSENWVSAFAPLHSSPSTLPPSLPPEAPLPGEPVCFYSPQRKATQSCNHCGVLISDIWSARWGVEVVCLKCLDQLRSKGGDSRFERKRMLWDNIALALALFPMTLIVWPAVFITAPAALFIAIRYWKGPFSMVPRSHLRMALALLISLIQVGVMVAGFLALWFRMDWLKDL